MPLPGGHVIREHHEAAAKNPAPGTQWFAISSSEVWSGRLSAWLDARQFTLAPECRRVWQARAVRRA